MKYNGTTRNSKVSYITWLNDIQNQVNTLKKYNCNMSIKGNVISLDWFKNRKEFAITNNLIKETLKIGIENNFTLPSFMIEQYGDIVPAFKTYNKSIVQSDKD